MLLLIAMSLTGCYSSHSEDIRAFMKPQDAETTAENYILEPPDEIEIMCTEIPSIDGQRQRIRPDGMISYEEIGELQAAGKTPAELAEEIRVKAIELYQLNYEKPVDVHLSIYQSEFYYVLGQVNSSGPQLYTGRDTVSKAIGKARPTLLARIKHIHVIRPSSDKNIRPAVFEVNYENMMAHGDNTKNVLLQEGDIIYVPPTILGWIAMKVNEFLTPFENSFRSIYTVSAV